MFDLVNDYNQRNYSRFSTLLRMTFDEALAQFPDGSIDLLHIDGLHTYEAVKHDFTTWLPKVAPGGMILFHDIGVHEGDFGVWKLWDELKAKYTQTLEFSQSHGLGVLRVPATTASPAPSLPWLPPYNEEALAVTRYFTNLGLLLGDRLELKKLQAKVQKQDQDIQGLKDAEALAKSTIAMMKNSMSWKITAPGRWLEQSLKKPRKSKKIIAS